MTLAIAVLIGALQAGVPDAFAVRCDLQGTYDEMASAMITAQSAADIDMYHDTFYASDWVFTDIRNQRHEWPDIRRAQVDALQAPAPDTLRFPIQKLSSTGSSVTALVHVVTVRTVTDVDGKYGAPGKVHTIAETTPMRDTWIRVGNLWRLQARQQVGPTQQRVDRLPHDLKSPRCPTQ
ncbi:MAG TPA: hypothetical protein VFA59_10010 [Vicinamibacterales bacterium]|nr:hypothetical protein [Vicinamibacterales bacterium]